MTRTIIALVTFLAFGCAVSEEPEGIGSCASDPQPICISGRPVCVCNYSMQCFWSCR
jgi:hypothetical protein